MTENLADVYNEMDLQHYQHFSFKLKFGSMKKSLLLIFEIFIAANVIENSFLSICSKIWTESNETSST